MNINLDNKLSVKTQRKKIYIVDGIISYPITILSNLTSCGISCPCIVNKKTQNDNKIQFCKHVQYYMHYRGLDLELLSYWIRMKRQIVDALSGSNLINNAKLWDEVNKNILDADCGFCLGSLKCSNKNSTLQDIHICTECQGIVHKTCFNKWNKKSNGCMLCRAGAKDC